MHPGQQYNKIESEINPELQRAIDRGDTELALALIAAGADLNVGSVWSDGSAHSNLYWAIKEDHLDVALVLIAKGADLSAGFADVNGGTTSNLYKAIVRGSRDVVLALIHKGAKLSVKVYNKAIQERDYAKALVQRLYREKGFPSLKTLCMFYLPVAPNNSELPESLVKEYDSYKDIEFLKKHWDELHPLSAEISEEYGFPPKALSMFKS